MAEGTVQLVKPQETTVIESLTRGEIDVQIATAHRFPRNIKRAVDEAKSLATLTQETAESMGYALPRAGKVIRGPSVRLAEVVGYTWGNLRYGARVVDMDAKFVTAQGVCHDLEKNVSATSEVKRRITDKAGRRYNDDMLTVASNAACSIALRNAIFKVIPFALAQEVYAAAMKVAVGDMKSLAERRQRAMAYFTGTLGVEEERVLAVIGRRSIDEVTLDDLATLSGLKTAIKDGEISLENAFPPLTKPSTFTPGTPGRSQPQPQVPQQPDPEPPGSVTDAAAPQPDPEAPMAPQGDVPHGPPAPQEPAQRPRQEKQVRRATHGPFPVPEDLVEWFRASEVRTAGMSAETLWTIVRALRDNPGLLRLVDAYFGGITPPLSRPELVYLREEEGVELLERLRRATAPDAEPEAPTGEGEPQAEKGDPAACDGFQVGELVHTGYHRNRGTILRFQRATNDRGPTAVVRMEEGDMAGKEIAFYVSALQHQEEAADISTAEANGWVACKGPHAGQRVSATAVCRACPEASDCPELAEHRRRAAASLL